MAASVGTITKSALNPEQQELLNSRISDLSLQISGTHLETLINQLYRELEQAGISFKPPIYLSDEWGCPHGIPVIGVPFYLANSELYQLEYLMTGIEPENDEETLALLRHEAGHAFNYAYRLYSKVEWRKVFGEFTQPYSEIYRTVPFSARFVRHVPGWYVQKHPDDDFAETFAVWLTPGSNWRENYVGTLALTKLLYIDKLAHQYGPKKPIVKSLYLDRPVQEIRMTLAEWYQSCQSYHTVKLDLPAVIDIDLQRLFPEKEGQPAVDTLHNNKKSILREVNNWTGLDRHILYSLFNDLLDKTGKLGLKINPQSGNSPLVGITAFITALAMNYQCTGRFIEI